VIDETLRAGLRAAQTRPGRPYKLKPASLGGALPGINLDRALTLADIIEDQELAAKMQPRE
jgi:hypothetical protein